MFTISDSRIQVHLVIINSQVADTALESFITVYMVCDE